ncbi:polysaccharide deacetylase family protein [Streptomyces sp. NPDC089919]|uniref:polysaccharide deacetylase family protein n=1 Tax=Streptomyces sp. NPDC089919 TaxID=3155188 RepID=UPI00343B42FD
MKLKYGAQAVVVASALALSGVVWGAAELVASERHEPTAPVARPKDQPPAAAPPRAPVAAVSQEIAHAPESGDDAVNVTIDDGPDPVWTPKVLDVLRENGVKAVFCMIGPQAAAHPDLVRKVVAEGHRLCDHTMSHDTGMDKKPVPYQRKEILDAKRLIEQAAGGTAKVEYYRAPGGAFTPDSRRIAAEAGMRPLGWNVDSEDYKRPGTRAILATVRGELPTSGGTILFHDGGGNRAQTVAALNDILPWLKEKGRPTSFPVKN